MKMRLGLIVLLFTFPVQIILAAPNSAEFKTLYYFNKIKNKPEKLLPFLSAMPKGADLHNHLSGATYSEKLVKYASQAQYCIDKNTYAVSLNLNCDVANQLNTAIVDLGFLNHLIDTWSMRHFMHNNKESGHHHFFSTFGKFSALTREYQGEMLAEVANRAAKQNESYLELMITPDSNQSGKLGKTLGFDPDFTLMRNKLLNSGLNDIVKQMSFNLDKEETKKQKLLVCSSHFPLMGCQIKVRYLYQVAREQPPEMVFAQLLAGFEIAEKDKRVVGLNMVQAEDGPISMRDYKLHMQMVGFLHQFYPRVNVSLHAGELTEALVSKRDLAFHINDAVKVALANRIGHGIDILNENNAEDLLMEMAKRHVLVEINLTSNALILEVEGKSHPLLTYIRYGVPVALSTDDEGINRSTLSKEYLRAVQNFKLDYLTLKQLARNSLMYAFLPGKSLWMNDGYHEVNFPCTKDKLGISMPSPQCRIFLMANEKANMQWDLEKRFNEFEKKY